MVTLYTWLPSTPLEMIAMRRLPDLGHSSLQVIVSDGHETYISYWPELTGIIGMVTHHFHPPKQRDPSTIAEEIKADGDYMGRPPEERTEIEGLDETRIIKGWEVLRDSHYDLQHWNCSDVTRFLILHAMAAKYHAEIAESSQISLETLSEISNFQEVREVGEYLATRYFIDTRPGDVVLLANAYTRLRYIEQETATD